MTDTLRDTNDDLAKRNGELWQRVNKLEHTLGKINSRIAGVEGKLSRDIRQIIVEHDLALSRFDSSKGGRDGPR